MSTQRQPKGIPVGGQFAPSTHEEASTVLPGRTYVGPEEIALELASDWQEDGETRDQDIRLVMSAIDADEPSEWRPTVDFHAALEEYVGDSDTSDGFDRADMVTFAEATRQKDAESTAESVATDWTEEGQTLDEDYRLALSAIETSRARNPVDIHAALEEYVGDSDTSDGFDRADMVTFAEAVLHRR